MQKALKILKEQYNILSNDIDGVWIDPVKIDEAIKDLEILQAEYKEIKEYYWFAKNHIESYRCKCGALGRVGYLCSNKECKYE